MYVCIICMYLVYIDVGTFYMSIEKCVFKNLCDSKFDFKNCSRKCNCFGNFNKSHCLFLKVYHVCKMILNIRFKNICF